MKYIQILRKGTGQRRRANDGEHRSSPMLQVDCVHEFQSPNSGVIAD
jgi:hypothetical protein